MRELKLSEIWIYPVKSLGGIPLKSAKVFPKGLELDRRWMLVDEKGIFMTQRAHPRMALFKLAIHNNIVTVNHGADKIELPSNNFSSNQMEVQVWDDVVTTLEVGAQYNQWFSDRLGLKCKLVFFPEKNPRPVDPHYAIGNDNTSLSDAYPFLIIGQSSLDDLNSRLAVPVPMNRFRPNFVFTGGEPFEEDLMREFSIGHNRFVAVKPCSRCVITTVNQDTGEKGTEPLKTLATYRQQNNKPNFGQNVIAIDHKEIHVGDIITYVSRSL